jgi:cullin-4
MAKDIDLSNDIMRAYRTTSSAVAESESADSFDLSVAILTTGNWPNYTPVALNIPVEMVKALDRFKGFYTTKYSGRTLQWQHSLDQCTLRANFPKGRKELAVSLYQALVLLLFNGLESGAKLGFRDIVAQTLIGEAEFAGWGSGFRTADDVCVCVCVACTEKKEAKRTLQSLACGRVRVLIKHPKGRDVNDSDEFSFNEEFRDDHYKLRVNAIQMKETVCP